ncbi:MAG: DUF1365 domain-containing protein [Pseudobdellovibrio sp.]
MSLYFLKGHVYHARTETAENSFRYPIFNIYFSVEQFENLLAAFKGRFFRMLSFSSADYLRGKNNSIKNEIDSFVKENFSFLRNDNFDDVFLQTIPKMFGYVFNPVSFWYFFKESNLTAVLCEVSNTFGEKHYYWLTENSLNLNNQWVTAEKEFHVSPFFDLKGHYKFKFNVSPSKLEAHIQFIGQDVATRLITWIKGELFSFDRVTPGELFFKYGWMTPLVVIRIHLQAVKLYLKKVQFFTKPDLPKNEVTHVSRVERG